MIFFPAQAWGSTCTLQSRGTNQVSFTFFAFDSYLKAGLAAGEKAEAETNKVAMQKAVFIFSGLVVEKARSKRMGR